MERANEETSLVPRPQSLPSPPLHPSTTSSKVSDTDALVTASLSNGVSVGNGTVFPHACNGAPKDRPVSGIVPPYWSHHRNASRTSQISFEQPAITLEDHTEDPDSETSRGLWARSVSVDDHVIVQGKSGIGAYVVWSCTIQTLEGGPISVRMRYSEFDDLRQKLVSSFPHAKNALPALPPKSVLFKFRPAFLESRRAGLEYFLNCILLNPEFSSSPVVKDFLFGRMC
ncbi:Phox homologous domain-containing protein [Aspergillus bertholletiae]|uniref:Endosomal/vacuolar adapter protein YPT35 n=1 Tax=Aspergillus bertholletiae TaxID=1226010 RepID=A0A5N7BKA3_9EURO|nr:Phox homologous domain-containing protein [Aspergillus bertholletiae]